MNKGRIKVELCEDHFERVLVGDVCISCPSRAENEAIIRAVAAAARENPRAGMEAIFLELSSIRKNQYEIGERLSKIDETIKGNGKPGILNRITAIETKISTLQWVVGVSIGGMALVLTIIGIALK